MRACISASRDAQESPHLLKVSRWQFHVRVEITGSTLPVKPSWLWKNETPRRQHCQNPGRLWKEVWLLLRALLPGAGLQMVGDKAGRPGAAAGPPTPLWWELGLPVLPSFLARPRHRLQLSWTSKAIRPPILTKVTPAMPTGPANPTARRANFNKPVLGVLHTLGAVSNPGLYAWLMKNIYISDGPRQLRLQAT